ncbi:MAG TPA: methyltransferase domain-containing protein [Thermoleophilaceae bacterium]|nr:methyltransferase domain-containing protein [Thermoleophilaceae bacterium]
MAACEICGGTEFDAGPRGRLAATGKPPRCVGCSSLERHRALRGACLAIPTAMLGWRRALQFSPDISLLPEWFGAFELSVYDGENSMDVQDVPRPAGSYDFVSINHVIEYVPDDRGAFAELVRIGSECSIIQILFSSTLTAPVSAHYDEPQTLNRHHNYGQDLLEWFKVAEYGIHTVAAEIVDSVTEYAQPAHFFCRQRNDAATIATAFRAAGIAVEHITPGT